MNFKSFAAAATALLFPIAAQAKTGAQLREDCAAFDQQPKGNAAITANLARMSDCITYIGAVLDVPLLYEIKGGDDYCVPEGTTRGAAVNVVREAIRQPDVAKMNWPGSGPRARSSMSGCRTWRFLTSSLP